MKCKRILAICAVLILLALYGSTLVFAMSGSPNAQEFLMASLFCTIVLPVLLYAYQLWFRYSKNHSDLENAPDDDDPPVRQ